MSSRVRVHLFGPGSIQKISEPQGKKTVSGELEAKQRRERSAFLFGGERLKRSRLDAAALISAAAEFDQSPCTSCAGFLVDVMG